MSDLTFIERRRLEKLFDMGGGYVLDFTNRTFEEFVQDAVGKDICDHRYEYATGSKANRLRRFWKIEPNHVVGSLVQKLVDYATTLDSVDRELVPACREVAGRLLNSAPVSELDAISATTDDRTFEALARSVREAIDNDKPETGLDRLHTYAVKYLRTVCEGHGITVDRGRPLHSLIGAYAKQLRADGRIESEMTERILKSSIATFEAFNHVRNGQSFAHDNPILGYDESLLIFNHVCSVIRFIQSLEQVEPEPPSEITANRDDVPF